MYFTPPNLETWLPGLLPCQRTNETNALFRWSA